MFSFQGTIWILKDSMKSHALTWDFSQSFLFWWRLAGSNRWPPACKAGALPAELNPHIVEIKSTICAFNASIKCSSVALFLLSPLNPLRWALTGTPLDLFVWSGGPGLAFLRESQVACNSPPDCCQEPPFESILACCLVVLNCPGLDSLFRLLRSGGPKWTRTIDLTIISRVL